MFGYSLDLKLEAWYCVSALMINFSFSTQLLSCSICNSCTDVSMDTGTYSNSLHESELSASMGAKQFLSIMASVVSPGRLCLKHHLLFYSFIPPK